MKAFKSMAFLLMAGTTLSVFTSCEEENDDKFKSYSVVGFEEENFTNLIDDPQYNGPILYGGTDTQWSDQPTTLSGGTKGSVTNYENFSYNVWDNGIAISNYIDADIENHADFNHQLAVPVSNGSKNFGVVWTEATINFADNKARQINSISICPTTYLLGVMQNGNGFAKALTEKDDFFTLTLTAGNGKSINVDLARDGQIQTQWKNVSLSQLGKTTSLTFSFSGSDNGAWGLNTPKYVAIDNINVSTGL
ncbi:MAG: DUF4465 domain-containing protein [Bacteroidaceae bacterium]|nr:DUF4465 domain-containing protein [Bacteroidaceae bacterium]